jgi:arginine repressor
VDAIVGTVAGDDTVLVVVDEELGGKAMAARLGDVAGIGWGTTSSVERRD